MARNKQKSDYVLVGIIFMLVVFGLSVLYSASTVVSFSKYHSTTYYFYHQLLYGTLIGLVLMYICSRIDYHFWQKVTPLLMVGTIFLLMAVLVPGVGFKVGNSRRWIYFAHVFLQPAEIAKLVLIFYIASWIDRRRSQIKDFYYGMFPTLFIIAI